MPRCYQHRGGFGKSEHVGTHRNCLCSLYGVCAARKGDMQPYVERSTQIALSSSIAVMVLLNPDATDLEFWPLRPAPLAPCALTGPQEFTARGLRVAGVVGLTGLKAACAFKEPLEDRVVASVAAAFLCCKSNNGVRLLEGFLLVRQNVDKVHFRILGLKFSACAGPTIRVT